MIEGRIVKDAWRRPRVNRGCGGKQRACCIVYDAVGPWKNCNKTQLTYWHCLDDEVWKRLDD